MVKDLKSLSVRARKFKCFKYNTIQNRKSSPIPSAVQSLKMSSSNLKKIPIVVIGDSGTGKSCLLLQFVDK